MALALLGAPTSASAAPQGTPTGNFERAAGVLGAIEVKGWVIDPDTAAPIYVWVTVDGVGRHLYANRNRADVHAVFPAYGAKHGFSGTLRAEPGNHTVCVTASNVGPGSHKNLGCRTVKVVDPSPFGNFELAEGTAGGITVKGWAIDPDTAAPIYVWVTVDGAGRHLRADGRRTDVASAFPAYGANHGFRGTIRTTSGSHVVCVVGSNTGTGSHSSFGCRRVVSPRMGQVASSNASVVPAQADPGKSWRLSFSEEFNGSDYDRSKLTPCFDWNYGGCTASFNAGREIYRPSQVQVWGGAAHLIAQPMSPAVSNRNCLNGQCTYRSGLLSTARPSATNGSDYLYAFTYGYAEARMKVPGTRGFFSAFWMLPAAPSYDYAWEIDILEVLGADPSTVFMTYHSDDRSRRHTVNDGRYNNGACAVKDYSQDYHRFGVDWQPDGIAWYIDGVKCGEYTDASKIGSGPMQLILNVMVDHSWQREWGVGLTDPTLTDQLDVDYIRVYQQR